MEAPPPMPGWIATSGRDRECVAKAGACVADGDWTQTGTRIIAQTFQSPVRRSQNLQQSLLRLCSHMKPKALDCCEHRSFLRSLASQPSAPRAVVPTAVQSLRLHQRARVLQESPISPTFQSADHPNHHAAAGWKTCGTADWKVCATRPTARLAQVPRCSLAASQAPTLSLLKRNRARRSRSTSTTFARE